MSRVGLNPITIPEGVQYKFEDQVFSVNSQKGNLSLRLAWFYYFRRKFSINYY